jgi:hypothetical protein
MAVSVYQQEKEEKRNVRGVELDEFKILKGETGTCDHTVTVSGAGVGTCAAEVSTAVTTSCEDSLVCTEAVERAVFQVEGSHTHTLASFVHDAVSFMSDTEFQTDASQERPHRSMAKYSMKKLVL